MRAIKIYVPLLALITALMLSSCVVSGGNTEQSVELKFEVGSRIDTETGSVAENKVVSVRVMAFYPSGTLDEQQVRTNPAGFTTIPVAIDITVMSGHKHFYVIANEPSSATSLLDAVQTLDDLKTIQLDNLITANVYDTADPLPMTAVKTEYIDPSRTLSSPVSVEIRRAVGKVRGKISKHADNNYNVRLESAQIKSAATESSLLEENRLTGSALGLQDLPAQSFSSVLMDYVTAHTIDGLYLYENRAGKHATYGDAITAGATYLEVVIDVERTAGTWTRETYRFPLIGSVDDSDGEYVYEVRRNTIADFTLVAEGDGINITYTVLDWEEETYDKVPGEDDSNMKVEDWIGPVFQNTELPNS